MTSLIILRRQLGLSQQAMAVLLGVSRSTVSLVELGHRVLPNEAWLQYLQLQQQVPKKEKPFSKRRANPYVRIPKHPAHELDRLQSYLQLKSLQLKMQANMMEQQRETAAAAMVHLGKAFHKPDKKQKNVIAIRELDATRQLDKYTERLIAEYRKLSKLLAKAGEGGGG